MAARRFSAGPFVRECFSLGDAAGSEPAPEEVGTVMGSSQGFSGLGRTIGPTWGGFFSGFNPALPFFLTAAAVSLTIWFGIRIVLGKNAQKADAEAVEKESV